MFVRARQPRRRRNPLINLFCSQNRAYFFIEASAISFARVEFRHQLSVLRNTWPKFNAS